MVQRECAPVPCDKNSNHARSDALRRLPGASRCLAVCAAASFALLAACGGGGDGGQPPPPDLSGVWSGAWQGSDPTLGSVSGTWEVTITQGASSASGPGTLLGDVDCMDGLTQTNPNAQTAVTGTVTRAPCGTVNWTLTALNVGAGAASGTWTNAQTFGSGTMTGTRIARLNGPRILFVSPPGGKAGAVMTVVGQGLSGLTGGDAVEFNGTAQPVLQSADATRIVASVPAGATTGPVQVSTAAGVALSPLLFNADVISPPAVLGGSITQELGPAALAVSPDGRKFYVAYRGNNRISVVRAATLLNVVTRDVVGGSPRSVAASPDGKRIYVAAAGIGVLVMDAAIAVERGRVNLAIADQGRDNPQGIAVSPDGRLLLLSSGTAGGGVSVFSISGDVLTLAATHAMDPGFAPLGVAFSPDGARAYVAAANTAAGAGTLRVFNPADGALLDNEAVGDLPTGVAVSPNGNLVFVSNKNGSSVSVYNSASQSVVGTVTVGAQPTGIAYGPDGTRVYVASQGSNQVTVLDGTTGAVIGSPLAVPSAPLAIAINASGTTAYVSRLTANSATEIGGMRTLTVVRSGSGIGTVRSTPVGIDCGTLCQAQFPLNAVVALTPVADSRSFFSQWSGDADCSDGTVILNQAVGVFRNCIAVFNSNQPPPSQQQQNCFIATAAYGSEMAWEVGLLREFRGRWLMTNEPGRAFVRFYYRNSPALAEAIRDHDGARAAVRVALWPVVWTIAHPANALCFVLSCGLLGFALRRRISARAG
jgi:YVTN family beta-propeller protein